MAGYCDEDFAVGEQTTITFGSAVGKVLSIGDYSVKANKIDKSTFDDVSAGVKQWRLSKLVDAGELTFTVQVSSGISTFQTIDGSEESCTLVFSDGQGAEVATFSWSKAVLMGYKIGDTKEDSNPTMEVTLFFNDLPTDAEPAGSSFAAISNSTNP